MPGACQNTVRVDHDRRSRRRGLCRPQARPRHPRHHPRDLRCSVRPRASGVPGSLRTASSRTSPPAGSREDSRHARLAAPISGIESFAAPVRTNQGFGPLQGSRDEADGAPHVHPRSDSRPCPDRHQAGVPQRLTMPVFLVGCDRFIYRRPQSSAQSPPRASFAHWPFTHLAGTPDARGLTEHERADAGWWWRGWRGRADDKGEPVAGRHRALRLGRQASPD